LRKTKAFSWSAFVTQPTSSAKACKSANAFGWMSLSTMPVVHAQLVAQLLDGRYFADAGPLLLVGLLLSRSLLGFFAGVRSRSRLAMCLALLGGAGGLLILDARMLDLSRVVIPMTLLVIACSRGLV
jgi:hypothetical protein